MLYRYQKLRGRIVEKYGTNKAFAEKLGLSENSLSKKLKGKTGISQRDIQVWSELLDIDPAEYALFFCVKS